LHVQKLPLLKHNENLMSHCLISANVKNAISHSAPSVMVSKDKVPVLLPIMDISLKLKKLIAKFRVPCYALGLEFMDEGFKFNLRTLNIAVFVCAYMTCTAYTICTARSLMLMQCLTSVGMGVQGCTKFPIPLIYKKLGYGQFRKVEMVYDGVQRLGRTTDEYKLLSKCVHFLDKTFSLYLLIFAGVFVITVSYPLIMYFGFGEKVLIITVVIPGVDPFGQYGFIAHGICHVIMAAICVTGLSVGDFYFMFSIAHIYVFVEFIRFRFQRLNTWLLDTQNEVHDREWHKNLTQQVDEILEEHQNLLEYMNQLDEMYFLAIAAHIGSSTFSLGIALFMTVTVSRIEIAL
jgi:hypothetical protein